MNQQQTAAAADETDTLDTYDAVVVGAGPLGLYQLYMLREQGLSVRCFEEADGVGGTWHWNRYPGARNDSQTETYGYSFSEELIQEWDWKHTFSAQPENEKYFNYVADRFDLRRHIEFNSRISSATYDESTDRWEVTTESGRRVTTHKLVLAVGILSARHLPKFEGVDSFEGPSFHTSRWPKEPVDLDGKRVAVIGTGSTGIQVIETISPVVGHLTVFQRTANYVGPLRNAEVTPELQAEWKANYPQYNKDVLRTTLTGFPFAYDPRKTLETPPEERLAFYEELWSQPGFAKWLGNFHDIMLDHQANEDFAEFVRNKVRARVKDPVVAEKLVPKDHPFGSKRIPLETRYYDAFNQDNVVLVDVKETPIQRITPKGIQTSDAEYEFDVIIYATGYDAVTGPVRAIDITGVDGQKISDKFADASAYLTMAINGFPNLFVATSTIISNYMVSGEIVVEWVSDCIQHMTDNDIARMEPAAEAEKRWVDMRNFIGNQTMLTEADSWFVGANIPGKPRGIVMHPDSLPSFSGQIKEEAAAGYPNFIQRQRTSS